jgi:hypothetical protein
MLFRPLAVLYEIAGEYVRSDRFCEVCLFTGALIPAERRSSQRDENPGSSPPRCLNMSNAIVAPAMMFSHDPASNVYL